MDFLIFQIVILIFSIVLHEVSHGWVANSLGDPTAKNAGRLTLNPLPHIDPLGSIFLPLLLAFFHSPALIGWAKPVPINPMNLTDQKWGNLKVALAGPASNVILAVVFGLVLRFTPLNSTGPLFEAILHIININLLLALFNLIPIPPLDGSHVLFTLLPRSLDALKNFLAQYGPLLILFLVFFFPPFSFLLLFLRDFFLSVLIGYN
ncbi:MAG: site-2 protease family protein [bacterium]|nr:site-2 protease family protein [Candidatus Wildermuthbacteria bacterium]MDP2664904.1 site-2 protease family protein [bacterium]